MGVDEFMAGGFADGMEDDGSDDGEEGSSEDDESLQAIEDLPDEGTDHAQDLAKLAKKDPEFFKYLQENDRDLLNFANDDEEDGEDQEMEGGTTALPKKSKKKANGKQAEIVTAQMLKAWQKSILKVGIFPIVESLQTLMNTRL